MKNDKEEERGDTAVLSFVFNFKKRTTRIRFPDNLHLIGDKDLCKFLQEIRDVVKGFDNTIERLIEKGGVKLPKHIMRVFKRRSINYE